MTNEGLIAAARQALEEARGVGRFLGRDPRNPEVAHLLDGHTATFAASRRVQELLNEIEMRGLNRSLVFATLENVNG